jgi:hypothetical protein
MEFGVDRDTLNVIDNGAPRTPTDLLKIHQVPEPTVVSTMLSILAKYADTVETQTQWNGITPTTAAATLQEYNRDPAFYRRAVRLGDTIYRSLGNGLTKGLWASAYVICHRSSPVETEDFFEGLHQGSIVPAILKLRDKALRQRTKKFVLAGTPRDDISRLALETILRSFIAYRKGGLGTGAIPNTTAFALSKV